MTQQLTIPWLIYSLTNSAWLLGFAGFLQFLPTLLLIPFSGVLSDRWNRRDLLMLVQILGITISAILTVLTFLNLIQFGSLLLLSVLNGLLKGLDMPVRHSIVTELVDDRDDWSNAIALNSMMLSSSLLLEPAIGGLLIATVGVKYCFLFDTLSYIAAILTLSAMRLRPKLKKLKVESGKVWQELQEGFHYVSQAQPIRAILFMLALQSLFGISYIALLPIFAADVLRGNASTMAVLSTSGPIGSLAACFYLSLRRGIDGLEKLIILASAMAGTGLIFFGVSRLVWLSALILIVAGGFGILQIACSNTIIQTCVEDDKRGRVMSFCALAMVGMIPFGNLIAGSLAQWFGASEALMICGSVCLLGSAWFVGQAPFVDRWIKQESSHS